MKCTLLLIAALFVAGCAKDLPDTPKDWAKVTVAPVDKAPPQCSERPTVPSPTGSTGKELARYSDKLLDTVSEYQRVHSACGAWAVRR